MGSRGIENSELKIEIIYILLFFSILSQDYFLTFFSLAIVILSNKGTILELH